MATNRPIPFEATHPGSILKEELKERGISHDKFAVTIGVEKFIVSEIINEKRNITPEFALKLETALGVSAEFWMNVQAAYEYDLLRIAARDEKNAKENEHRMAYPSYSVHKETTSPQLVLS